MYVTPSVWFVGSIVTLSFPVFPGSSVKSLAVIFVILVTFGVTFIVHVVDTPEFLPLIVITAVPSAIPFTFPSAPTVAIAGLPDVYSKSSINPSVGVVVTFIFCVSPIFISIFPAVIVVIFWIIFTVHVAWYSVPSTFAVIVAVPLSPTAVIFPFSTFTMSGAELSHVIFPVVPSVSVAVIVSFSPLASFISFFDKFIPSTSSTV